jgi:hypothetical protein
MTMQNQKNTLDYCGEHIQGKVGDQEGGYVGNERPPIRAKMLIQDPEALRDLVRDDADASEIH